MSAPRSVRHTAPSFIASKLGSNRKPCPPVGAVLARDKGDAVCQAHRVIVLRGQARLQQTTVNPCVRCLPAITATRFVRHTALSFFAGKRAPTDHQNLLERGLPAI